jgi:hypothetical protein
MVRGLTPFSLQTKNKGSVARSLFPLLTLPRGEGKVPALLTLGKDALTIVLGDRLQE